MIRRLRSACVGAALVGTLVLARPVTAQPSIQPKNSDVTCPYLRQQRTDRQSRPIADSEMGRDVIDNLRLLRQADNLLELAKDLALDGFIMEAMDCCNRAAELCPGSPCAQRAIDTMCQLAHGSDENQTITMPNPKYMLDSAQSEPGVELMVSGMMKASHLLMNQGMQHEAAELVRQAYALDPQRVQADPLIYKMHLLGDVPATQPAGANEASEPPTCPYCPNSGKPIRQIVPEKTPQADNVFNREGDSEFKDIEIRVNEANTGLLMFGVGANSNTGPVGNYEFEASANASGLRLCAECSMNGNVYHVRFKNGCLEAWKTPDAGKTKP